MNNAFKKETKIYKEKINLYLQRFFVKETKKAGKISPFAKKIIHSLADYTLRGGKRIRALLMIYSYQGITGKITDEIIKSSISMELVQSSLLVHDDIMDRDDLRRGGPTIHKEYTQYLPNPIKDSANQLLLFVEIWR